MAEARRQAAETADMELTDRSLISMGSLDSEALPDQRSLSKQEVALRAEAAAYAADQEAARAKAVKYEPLPVQQLDPGAFGSAILLQLLPNALAERAQHYYAARERAEAALRRQEDTLRQLQFASARLTAEMEGGNGIPAAGWDAESAVASPPSAAPVVKKAPRAVSQATTKETERRVRRVIHAHQTESKHPLVVLDAMRTAVLDHKDDAKAPTQQPFSSIKTSPARTRPRRFAA